MHLKSLYKTSTNKWIEQSHNSYLISEITEQIYIKLSIFFVNTWSCQKNKFRFVTVYNETKIEVINYFNSAYRKSFRHDISTDIIKTYTFYLKYCSTLRRGKFKTFDWQD